MGILVVVVLAVVVVMVRVVGRVVVLVVTVVVSMYTITGDEVSGEGDTKEHIDMTGLWKNRVRTRLRAFLCSVTRH